MSVLLAMLLDRLFGEPPGKIHPVAWMGRYLGWAGRGLPARPPASAFLGGLLRWCAGASIFAGLFALAAWALAQLPAWLAVVGTALLLKPLFALHMLLDEVRAVEAALAEGLDAGRRRLAFIVSRDTTQLTEAEVRESALESLSENLSDSVVAPLFWFALLGLPGAALYRFANTADAMWGYRGEWEWAGKWAARVDDVLNFVPARLTALLLMVVGSVLEGPAPSGPLPEEGGPQRTARRPSLHRSFSIAREARKTPSPNSGWPMAAFALGLHIRLGKPGVYVLNPGGIAPGPEEIKRGLRMAGRAGWISAGACALGLMLMGRFGHG